LGEIFKKFIKSFGATRNECCKIINIDYCIKEMKIGRRRIYDVINILESFKAINRIKKNEYEIKSAQHIK
jgi:hypothetical protein